MKNELNICMADIKNKIYEAGLFRPNEKVVLTTKSCVLLEYFTGKTYSYRMVDLNTLKAKRLFSRVHPLTENGYQQAITKMLALVSADTEEQQDRPTRSTEFLSHIFFDILPKHGLILRENQYALAISMLEAMEKAKVAICEAEVGTGKTHAYILAAVIYRLFHGKRQPVVISTSTIALQKALTENYIPQISEILLKHRIIDEPLTFAVRKGKNHYACDSRLKTYLYSIRHNDRPEDQELIKTLTEIFQGTYPIDLDELQLTDYVKERICVERCQMTCEFISICRYRTFLRKSGQSFIDFQILNHNLVLADVLCGKGGRNRLFPEHCVLIIDEAHKLLDAARQMYGVSFENMELERLVSSIYHAIGNHPDKGRIISLCEELIRQNEALFEDLKNATGTQYDHSCAEILFTSGVRTSLKAMMVILKSLSMLFFSADRRKNSYKSIVNRLDQKQTKLLVLFDHAQSIYWLENAGITVYRVCALPKQLNFLLYEDIWNGEKPYILTSATLSIGGDFSHFMNQTGINLLEQNRILTISKASPFDYRNQALLYLPTDMPFPDVKEPKYMEAVLEKLTELIRQTHGHTLALFTSYRMMEIAFQELSKRILDYPLFSMGKGRLEAIEAFRNSGNGILLASDSAGEGIDLAGDILSSLVVVKLPFPAPNPVSEYEKSLYDNFHNYLSESVVPRMLMKLRQWIGRGIRRETDTCVFSILDNRASGRYKTDILSALPDMPVTDQIEDVRRFLLNCKNKNYFEI